MTDQPQDPTTPEGEQPVPPVPPAPPSQPATPSASQPPAQQPPAQQPSGAPPYGQQPPPYGQQPDPYGQQPPYGAPAYGQPGSPPPGTNPYGGYAVAPAYAGGRPMHPGSIGYVEQNFGRVADFGQRVLALLIDAAIGLIAVIPMFIAIPIFIASAPRPTGYVDEYGYQQFSDADGTMLGLGFLFLALGFLLGIGIQLWNRVFRMGRTGQSVGKSVIGLKLVNEQTGQPIGAGSCFVRELLGGLINQLVYLSYLWMLWDDNRQTLADKVVHSTVIVVPKS